VGTDALESTVLELGQQLAQLDKRAHAETKLRARRTMLEALRIAIEADRPDFDASV
jgi:enoyl-CoA hydratase